MLEEERSYFRARAEEEIEAALSAGHPEAARAHYRLAGYYLDLAYNPAAGPEELPVNQEIVDAARRQGQIHQQAEAKSRAYC